jgi:hypothetical protein
VVSPFTNTMLSTEAEECGADPGAGAVAGAKALSAAGGVGTGAALGVESSLAGEDVAVQPAGGYALGGTVLLGFAVVVVSVYVSEALCTGNAAMRTPTSTAAWLGSTAAPCAVVPGVVVSLSTGESAVGPVVSAAADVAENVVCGTFTAVPCPCVSRSSCIVL